MNLNFFESKKEFFSYGFSNIASWRKKKQTSPYPIQRKWYMVHPIPPQKRWKERKKINQNS